MGLDLTPGESELDLSKLSALVGTSLKVWHKGVFKRPVAKAERKLGEIRLVLDGVASELRESVRSGLVVSLKEQGVTVTDLPTADWALHVDTQIQSGSANQKPLGLWKMSLSQGGRQVSDNAQYETSIPGKIDAKSIEALTRMAANSYAEIVVSRLRQSPESAFARR